ncbi:MAG: hypothetical protein QOG71_719 [Pyrinomonadaceae bacterium]|nr:hypothetical protein [Pyrinomonadaceae bacterium]
MTNTHDVVDEFVRVIRAAGVPVAALDAAPWIEQFEQRLPARLPSSFRSLVTRYAFPAFTVGALDLFANTGEGENDLARAVFRDKVLAEVTQSAGYIQFARPVDGSYDPICFDTRGRTGNREYTIIRLDHEAVLQHSRIVVSDTMAKSFFEFVKSVVGMKEEQRGKIIYVSEPPDF